ncbi:MAG: Cupredoxin-like domain [Gaiellales bacterium]|jgi:plastocyanin|nr:Cupredoxin-like domain [Gaiellales bacterium]
MKKLRTALILFVLAAFALGGTALARTVSGTAQSAQAVADDGGGHHGDDSGQDDSGHHGDDADDDDGGATSGTTTSGAMTSTTTTGSTTTSSRRRSASPAAVVAGKQLIGTVGPGFSITLKTPSGGAVRTVRAGTYTVVVRDRSPEHNFHLRGRGIDKSTSEGGTATQTWRVNLAAGTYTFVCDPHASMMRGSLRVV